MWSIVLCFNVFCSAVTFIMFQAALVQMAVLQFVLFQRNKRSNPRTCMRNQPHCFMQPTSTHLYDTLTPQIVFEILHVFTTLAFRTYHNSTAKHTQHRSPRAHINHPHHNQTIPFHTSSSHAPTKHLASEPTHTDQRIILSTLHTSPSKPFLVLPRIIHPHHTD